MRTNRRNVIVILVLIVLVLPVVVACGRTKDSTSPETIGKTAESSQETLQEAEREPCTLASSGPLAGVDPRGQTVIWWHAYSGTREAGLQAMVNAFNVSNACGITVVAENHGTALRDEMRAALTTGELPGLIIGDQTDQAVYTLANGLVDLNIYIADETWGLRLPDHRAQHYPDFMMRFVNRGDGLRFGLPLTRTVDVFFYNTTWRDELGFSGLPTDTLSFKATACAAARARDAEGYIIRDGASAIASWTNTFGGSILNNDRTGYSYNNKAVIDAVTFLKELYDEGCASFGTLESPAAQFAARRALFVQGSSADIFAFKSAMDVAENTDEWGLFTIPSIKAQPAPGVYGSDLMIPATNPETQLAAWVFLNWFAAPEQQAGWVHIDEELPVREDTVRLLGAQASLPQLGPALALLPYGVPESQLVSYPAVREVVSKAFDKILQGDDIRGTLSHLHFDENELQKKALAGGVLPPKIDLCSPATSGPLAGIDPRGQTVTWWHPYSGAHEADVQAMIDAFNAANPCGIVVIGASQGNMLHDKLNDGIATGDLPGLAIGDQNEQAVYALANALVDINAYLADPDWGLTAEERADFFAPLLAQGVHPAFGGRRLGFPFIRSVEVVFYNQTWLETLRYSGSLTSTEVFETLTCAVAKARDAAQTGTSGYVLRTDATATAAWAAAFGGVSRAGGAILNADGDGYAYNTLSVVAAMTYLKDLYDEGCITSTITNTPSVHFAARRALFVLGSSADIPRYQRAMEATENTDMWGVAPLPYRTTEPASLVYGSDFIIPTTNPETQLAAWVFLKWFTAPEQQTRWMNASGNFPTRASVAAQVESEQFSPQWLQALALLPYGVYEPQLISYPSVNDAVTEAFNRIMQGRSVQITLDRLTREANNLQKRMME